MKLKVDRKALADGARAAAKFLPRLSPLPVLSHLDVEAHSNQLMISATNLEAGRTVEVEAEVSEEGRVLAPAAFADVAAGAAGTTLEIESSETLSISDGVSAWTLPLGNTDDYPEITPGDGPSIDIESWGRIQHVSAFAGGNKAKPTLQGVFFSEGAAVATDSYRLAWCEIPKTDGEALVPAAAIRSLDAPVKALQLGDRHVSAVLDAGHWWARVIDGTYLNWQSLVKQHKPETTVTVESAALDEAVRRGLLVAEPHIPIRVTFGRHGIELAHNQEGAGFSEIVEATVEGPDQEMAFNPAYLRAAVDPVERASITIEGQHKPIRISGDGWFEALLMPVRV